MDTEKQAVDLDGLLDELLAPRFTQSSPAGRSNEDANIYHSGYQVGVPFVLPTMSEDNDEDEDDDEYEAVDDWD